MGVGEECYILSLTLKLPDKLQPYGLYVYYVVHICDVGMLRVKDVSGCLDPFLNIHIPHEETRVHVHRPFHIKLEMRIQRRFGKTQLNVNAPSLHHLTPSLHH